MESTRRGQKRKSQVSSDTFQPSVKTTKKKSVKNSRPDEAILKPIQQIICLHVRDQVTGPELFVKCLVNGHHIDFLIDTGGQISLFPLHLVEKCQLQKYWNQQNVTQLSGSTSKSIISTGVLCNLPLKLAESEQMLETSFSVHTIKTPLLGQDFLSHFQCSIKICPFEAHMTFQHNQNPMKLGSEEERCAMDKSSFKCFFNNGIELPVVVDSGSTYSQISIRQALKINLNWNPIKGISKGIVENLELVGIIPFMSASINGIEWQIQSTFVVNGPSEFLIGLSTMLHNNVSMDFSQQKETASLNINNI